MIRKSSVAAALLFVLAAGCGGSAATAAVPVDSPSSPLGDGGVAFEECVFDPSGTTATNGVTVLDNQSKGTAVIEQVSFYGDQHLQVVQALVVPIQYDAVGVGNGWPPASEAINQPGVQWGRRVPATGARIPPGPAVSSSRNLVIGVRPTARRATAAGVQVLYRENGKQYELRTHTQFVIIKVNTPSGC